MGGSRLLDRTLRLVALLCLVAGIALLSSFAYGMVSGVREQQRLTDSWRAHLAQHAPPPVPIAQPAPDLMKPVDGVDFAVKVPRLDYYSAVKEGVDVSVLYSSPGHYPETPWPGQTGMIGVAAHNVYWIDFPELEREVAIIRTRAPGVDERLARSVARAVGELRALDLVKPPGVAEAIDWARALVALGADEASGDAAVTTLGWAVKNREDLQRAAESFS